MNRDHKTLLPRVLISLYPNDKKRNEVMGVLSSYGKASYHRSAIKSWPKKKCKNMTGGCRVFWAPESPSM